MSNSKELTASFFTSAFDNEPMEMRLTFKELSDIVTHDLEIDTSLPAKEAKLKLYAFSPTLWMQGCKRSNYNISRYDFIALDFDNSDKTLIDFDDNGKPIVEEKCCADPARPEVIHSYLDELGLEHCIYTSFSNNKNGLDWPKFRVLIPFTMYAHPLTWKEAVDYVLNVTGLSFWKKSIDVVAVKDSARIYFMSSSYYSPMQSWYSEGNTFTLSKDTIEKNYEINKKNRKSEKPPLKMTAKAEEKLKQLQKRGMAFTGNSSNDDKWWKKVKIDISKLDLVAFLEDKGFEVEEGEPYFDGMKYKCECPFGHEHSGNDKLGAAIFIFPDKWPAFKCLHTHTITLKEILCDEWRYRK